MNRMDRMTSAGTTETTVAVASNGPRLLSFVVTRNSQLMLLMLLSCSILSILFNVGPGAYPPMQASQSTSYQSG